MAFLDRQGNDVIKSWREGIVPAGEDNAVSGAREKRKALEVLFKYVVYFFGLKAEFAAAVR